MACTTGNGLPKPYFGPGDLANNDRQMFNWQSDCTGSLAAGLQMKQEAYLTRHPEVKALLEIFLCKVVKTRSQRGIFELAKNHFTRSIEELDKEIREYMKLPATGPYFTGKTYSYSDENLREYLLRIKELSQMKTQPTPESSATYLTSSHSSSYSTYVTSDTTQPTPEPIPTPPPTLSDHMFDIVSGTVDRAIFLKVDDGALLYDTAWVEIIKIREEAMEVPVEKVKEEIIEMLHCAYKNFELDILDKERIAFEEFLASRMKRTTKKTLRKIANFKARPEPTQFSAPGIATGVFLPPPDIRSRGAPPPPPQARQAEQLYYRRPGYKPPSPTVSSAEAATNAEYYTEVTRTEPRVLATYNRYSKDRFGVYRSINDKLYTDNITTTPLLSTSSSMVALPKADVETN